MALPALALLSKGRVALLAGAGVLTIVAGATIWYLKSELQEAHTAIGKWEQSLEGRDRVIDEQAQEMQRMLDAFNSERALREKENELRSRLREENDKLVEDLQKAHLAMDELERISEEAKDYLGNRIPRDVLNCLQLGGCTAPYADQDTGN